MSCGARRFPTKRKMTTATSPDWDSHKVSMKIIEAVKEHPVLYRPSEVRSSAVKLQELRQKVWNKIADDLGLDAGWMRLRWKNLRDTYSRILKNIQRVDRGERRKKWIFEDDLSFLKFQYEPGYRHQIIQISQEYIDAISSSSVNNTKHLFNQLEDKTEDNYTEFLDIVEGPTKTLNFIDPTHSVKQETKVKENLNLEEAVDYPKAPDDEKFYRNEKFYQNFHSSRRLRRTTDETDCYMESNGKSLELFFDSVTESVKRLPAGVQAEVKMKILQVVTEAEIKCSNGARRNAVRYVQQQLLPGNMQNMLLIPVERIDERNK